MFTTIFLGIFCVFSSYLCKFQTTKLGLKIAFVMIFLFLAIRYNFGNDYQAYVEIFSNTSQLEQFDFSYIFLSFYEPGWLLLNWIFSHVGFFAMTAFLALLNCIVYYQFIYKHINPQHYWLAIFLYIFYPGFMLIHASAMRQSVATIIFIFSINYLINKNIIKYLICITIACSFHLSAIVLFPVYFIIYWNKKINNKISLLIFILFSCLFLLGNQISPILKLLINSFSEKYDSYQDPAIVGSGLGFLYYSLLFCLVLWHEKRQTRDISIYFKLSIIGFMMIPLPLIINMTGRLLIYFTPATIIVYPLISDSFYRKSSKYIFIFMLIVITLFQFFQFFLSDIYLDGFGNYHTIFSSPKWI